MQASHYRTIKSGAKYAHLFPKAGGEEIIIKKGADVSDTLDFIPSTVYKTLSDTKEISKLLKGKSLYETCRNIWDFVYNHIQYHHDEEGVEQVRRPARTWMDRVRGVDCDCYTVFISSILTNLQIPHIYRITKYKYKNNFQHIYPIVPTTDGKYITIDAVVTKFNYEEPFTQKKDTPMNLSYLNGIDTAEENSLMAVSPNSDIRDLPDFQDFDGLGKIKIGEAFKKFAHVANKGNLAAVLLRLGVLASMKLNLFQIPKNLRYAYLTDDQVRTQAIDRGQINKLRKIKSKLEDIFYGAGGDIVNLKKAMLTGKGNKDHSVSGTDEFDMNTPLRELLSGIYDEEYVNATKEVNGLGDPATGTAIAAATTVLAAIAAVIKAVGTIKKGGVPVTDKDGGTTPNDTDNNATAPTVSPATIDDTANQVKINTREKAKTPDTTTPPADTAPPDLKQKANMEIVKTETPAPPATTTPPTTFMETAKAWMAENPKTTAAIGVATVAFIAFGVFEIHKHHHKTHPATTQTNPALSATPTSRKKRRGKRHKKAVIALL
ncbi:MAG: hypothetical protein ACHQII_00210 [Bacteroidia bacterium]